MIETLTTFDTPYNRADNYGARVTTYYLVSTLVKGLIAVALFQNGFLGSSKSDGGWCGGWGGGWGWWLIC